MSTINVDALLEERDPAEPCGPNLEYDPAFLELEQEVLGKPEVQYGATITPAVPPDWKVVKKLSLAMLERSVDLRIVLPLLRASIALDGVNGMASCFALIERLLQTRWDTLHPQLDPDDDNDPMLRINSLAMLVDGTTVLREARDCTLIVLPGLGPLSARDLEVANGEGTPAPGRTKLSMSSIEAALADVPVEQALAAADAMTRSFDSARAIETLLVSHVGSSQALNLDPLTRVLARGRDFLATAVPAAAEPAQAEAASDGSAPATGGAPRAAAISGEIASREDVLKMLDKICSYYERSEPSSPIPLLLQRAKRLVPKSFMEILEDMAPDGLSQITVISGVRPEPE
jgi:type VI secretion system protein ImpA